MVSEDIKSLVKDSVDVETLLLTLGFKITRTTENELRGPCKIHGGDNPTAFCFRTDTKRWRCFTKGCEEDSQGKIFNDLIALVMICENLNFFQALQYLADFAGVSLDQTQGSGVIPTHADITKFRRRARKLKRPTPLQVLTENQVAIYKSNADDYFLKQGFRPDTLSYFEIGKMTDNKGVPRATVPIRDSSGNLAGISGRRTDGDGEPRYKIAYGLEKDKLVYNMHNALATGSNTLILVEGFKACWAVFETGYQNVGACMGAALTPGQLSVLRRSTFENILIMFDGDEAGRKGMDRAIPRLERDFNNVMGVYLPEEISPDSITREELKELLDLYVLSLGG